MKVKQIKFFGSRPEQTLVETLPKRMNAILGANLLCTFRGNVV